VRRSFPRHAGASRYPFIGVLDGRQMDAGWRRHDGEKVIRLFLHGA
jgi:hypothetical protein